MAFLLTLGVPLTLCGAMNWIGSKLSRPLFVRAFAWMQATHPDSTLTAQAGALATAQNPLAPTGEDEPPFRAVSIARKRAPWWSLQGMCDALAPRAQAYALTRAVGAIWRQVMLPLTLALWVIKLLVALTEEWSASSARGLKSAEQHGRDVARVLRSITARKPDALLASAQSTSRGHMLRSSTAKTPATLVSSLRAEGTPARPLHLVDLSRLSRVISLDTAAYTCVVQAGCTFRDLLRVTTHSHLMPQVVPPYLSMTVGGAVSGSAIGSTSWQKGTFADGVLEIEVALPTGELITCTRDGEHAELFHALHSSYHSLATILSLKLQLVRAPRYVWQRYEICTSLEASSARLGEMLSLPVMDLEVLVFSPTDTVFCMNQGLDEIDPTKHKIVTLGHWWEMPYADYVLSWAQRTQQRGGPMPETHCIPLMDFLARYERGAFWQGSWLYSLLPWPLKGNSFASRLLFGWVMDEATIRGGIESSLHHAAFERTRLVQDALVPLHHLAPFLKWTVGSLQVTPLWLCPVLGSHKDFLAPNFVHADSANNSALGFHYINIGVYGQAQEPAPLFVDPAEQEEKKSAPSSQSLCERLNTTFIEQVYQAGGRTILHAHNWHSPGLWSRMYNRKPYDAVRRKYEANDAFPHVLDKVALPDHERAAMSEPIDPRIAALQEDAMLQSVMLDIVLRKLQFWT